MRLLFNDRLGIVADISSLIAEKDLNIISMEVERADEKADVYLEAEKEGGRINREEVFEILGKISDLIEISFIKTLPREERANRSRVVLDNISDGVISIDKNRKITAINRVASWIFGFKRDEVLGKDIKVLGLHDYAILDCLNGEKFTNVKKNIINEKGRFQFFATGRPIFDSSRRIVGAVEIGKDMQEIKMLAQCISKPNRITFSDIIGNTPAIKSAINFAEKIATTNSIVSIRGESGTGKELFARTIHTASDRKGEFVPINCAALPETILESELFGYMDGAFTGARRGGKAGLFEIAKNGTVFLDEIAEMPPGPQVKILRMIQEKKVRRIGGEREIPIDVRIITATNRNLEKMVEEKTFRQDLYYRINVLPIHIPPLKERIDDIPILVEHFLFQLASQLNKNLQIITRDALDKLYRHDWPGNIRELKNVIERASILSDSDRIKTDHILFSFEIGKNIKDMKTRLYRNDLNGETLKSSLGRYERKIITRILKKAPSIRKAAKSLGISHTALLNKIKKHRIRVES